MSFDWRLLAEVLITLFVIMDPPGNLPVFLGLTGGMSRAERHRAARQATLVSLLVIGLFAVAGPQILDYMHISVPALQASGGLLLLLVAMELLTGKLDPPEEGQAPIRSNVALVPLGTPLLAGPGAIVATMLFMRNANGEVGSVIAVVAGVLLIHVLIWATMHFAGAMYRFLGKSGTMLVSRIAGLLLAAIAAQMMFDAIREFFQM